VIAPGRLTLFLAFLLALLLVAAIVEPLVVPAVMLGDLLLLGICLLEGRRLNRQPLEVERDHWTRIQLGLAAAFPYRITNRSAHQLVVEIRQPWPDCIESENNMLEVRVPGGQVVQVSLTATARLRGTHFIPPAQISIRSLSDFARRRWTLPDGADIKVFPSLRGMSEYETLRRHHASTYAGLHRQRMVGAGREFEQLRDYLSDDDYRDINWKATARRSRPITNVYQSERSQDVLLCLDCGRMMGNTVGNGTALDRAIDAAIMLAHVANRQGDRVGLALFRDVVHRFVRPAAGMAAVNQIIEELVDAQPQGVFPSYAALIGALQTHQTRRSMVFLFTDLNDPQLAANLVEVLPLASRRHLLCVISLRDPVLDRVAAGPADGRRAVYQVLAARQLAMERATRTRALQKIGSQVLEADADSLTLKLLNAYLSIKSRQLL